jgi:hypothetical protein
MILLTSSLHLFPPRAILSSSVMFHSVAFGWLLQRYDVEYSQTANKTANSTF